MSVRMSEMDQNDDKPYSTGNRKSRAVENGASKRRNYLQKTISKRITGKTLKAMPSVLSFEVFLINKYRQRKKRFMVIDIERRTLSRSNRDVVEWSSMGSIRRTESTGSSSYEGSTKSRDDNHGSRSDLRKTIDITQYFLLLPSESDKKKLRLFVSPQARPIEMLFTSASAREEFSSIIRALRAAASAHHQQQGDQFGNGSTLGEKSVHGTTSSRATRSSSLSSAESVAPHRLNIYTTTFNCSKQPVPVIAEVLQQQGKEEGSSPTSTSGTQRKNSLHYGEEDAEAPKQILTLDQLYGWIPPDEFDVYFIALQECKAKVYPDWQRLILGLVNRKFESMKREDEYKLLSHVSMWGIHGILIVRNRLVKHFSRVKTDTRACGIGGVLGNKGAIGISFQYGEGTSGSTTSFAFVNSHLAARAERLPQRMQDYAEICHSLFHRKKKGLQLLHAFDHVFWLGDLNYRVDMGAHGSEEEYMNVLDIIQEQKVDLLAQHDQLSKERAKHNVFIGFLEGKLNFNPTYRLELGKHSEYNNKRNQNPSYTDRILWKSNTKRERVEQTEYCSCDQMIYSDHRPVASSFSVLTACYGENLLDLESKSNGNRTATISGTSETESIREVSFHFGNLEFFSRQLDIQQQHQLEALDEEPTQNMLGKHTDEDGNDIDDAGSDYDEDTSAFTITRDDEHDENEHAPLDKDWDLPLEMSEADKKRFGKSSRKHSYRRPVTTSATLRLIMEKDQIDHNLAFTGAGFGQGPGKLADKGDEHCREDSSEFMRYVVAANSGVPKGNTKLSLSFHANFLENTVHSENFVGGEINKSHIKFNWKKETLPEIKSFIHDLEFLGEQQIIVSIHASHGFFGNTVGYANISLQDVCENEDAWFAVPVLFNGLPCGILRGEIHNPLLEVHRASQITRKSRLSVESRAFVSDDEVDDDDDDDDEDQHTDLDEEEDDEQEEYNEGKRLMNMAMDSMVAQPSSSSLVFEKQQEEQEMMEHEVENPASEPGPPPPPPASTPSPPAPPVTEHPAIKDRKSDEKSRFRKSGGWLMAKMGLRSSSSKSSSSDIQKQRVYYPYELLLSKRFELPISRSDQTRLEIFLSDEEFEEVFHMTRDAFNSLPKWRRIQKKKQVSLF